MSKYDDLFDETEPDGTIFVDKSGLDPFAEPDEIIARDEQERELARILNGVHKRYLPPTVSIYGPPGTGKTLTTRRVCREFADRHEELAVEYVNLKECRSLFSAGNEILFELTGEKKGAYEGLDGVFEGIWEALAEYPEWTVLLLDEIDHIKHDSNYDPSEFFYRLLRGEGKLKRDIQLSVWLVSNELIDVDLRLDSRVKSAMSNESVFFPSYQPEEMEKVVVPRLRRSFHENALPDAVIDYAIARAGMRWGDVRKALTLFRRAGEMAAEQGLEKITIECIDQNLDTAGKEKTVEKLLSLPVQHFFVLSGVTAWTVTRTGEIVQPVTAKKVKESYDHVLGDEAPIGERAIREIITDLETMGLVETSIQSKGSEGRVKRIETTFDPQWVQDTREQYVDQSPNIQKPE